MPLLLPPSDERTFGSLMADVRARLPRLAPAWTDHNASDPGITLLELLAYLTETELYRLARVTTAQRRAFLRWFGLESHGPTVAYTVVALVAPGGARVAVDADRELGSAAGGVTFSTTARLDVQPGGIAGLFAGASALFTSVMPEPVAQLAAPALALGPAGDEAFTIALDRPASGEVTLYVWTGAADHDDERRRRVREESAPTADRHADVELVWEAFTATGWIAATVIEDSSRALTVSAFVRLAMPGPLAMGAVAASPTAFALRARRTRGRYEDPPVVQAVLLNAAPARHQTRVLPVAVGSSSGQGGQRFRLRDRPLVLDETVVHVGSETWTIVVDWDRAGPSDPVVAIDADTAELSFGDGRTGLVPPAGEPIVVTARLGGGAAGNVPAGTLVHAVGLAVDVKQPFAARGGGPAPTVTDLQQRLLADLARPTRAATLEDLERLALDTPGVTIARARAVAERHPDFPGLPAPGCVTVVIVPQGPGAHPEPTRGTLTAVRRYLGRRRPVATELHVIAPTYTRLAVRARMHLGPHDDAVDLRAEAARRLDAYFHPLTGGDDGTGWPIGRHVYRSEVLALLQGIRGVHHVDALALLSGPEPMALCTNVRVCPTDLIVTASHDLTIAPVRIR